MINYQNKINKIKYPINHINNFNKVKFLKKINFNIISNLKFFFKIQKN